jgi:hypothetical protein
LHSLLKNSKTQHDIVLVTEDGDAIREYVRQHWSHFPTVRVISSAKIPLSPPYPPVESGEYNPVYQFLNDGADAAQEEWILTPAGDDSYFPEGWEVLLDHVNPSEKMSMTWTPGYLCVMGTGSDAEKKHYGGPNPGAESRGEYRIYADSSPTIPESAVIQAVKRWTRSEVVRERVGDRHRVGWAHSVIHRDLFNAAGKFNTVPPYPAGNDVDFCAVLGRRGVHTDGVHASVIVNAKVPIALGQ